MGFGGWDWSDVAMIGEGVGAWRTWVNEFAYATAIIISLGERYSHRAFGDGGESVDGAPDPEQALDGIGFVVPGLRLREHRRSCISSE